MTPTTTTRLTLTYQAKHKAITAQQFRGAFIDYIRHKFTDKEQKALPMRYAYNKDEYGKQLNGYTLIQYNTYADKLEILAIGNTEKILDLWLNKVLKNNDFTINGKEISLSKPEKTTLYWYPELGKHQLYRINNWIPFDSKSLGDETRFDKIIWGNIHRMLTDLEIKFKDKVHINIHEYKRKEKPTKGFDVNWITYNLVFSTNINLPEHIGIGHIVSLGKGKITKISML